MSHAPSAARHLGLLKAWHAWLAGSYLVAYLTAGEDTYALHQFAGYAVLAALVARLAAGLMVGSSSLFRLPRPSLQATRLWLLERKGRNPLFAGMAAALLAVVGFVAVSGALADGVGWLEHPHEAIAEASLWLVGAHVAFVGWMHGGRRLVARMRERFVARGPARGAIQ